MFLDNNGFGMINLVTDIQYPKYILLTPLGEIINGEKIYKKEYQNSFENYYLKAIKNKTEVMVETSYTKEMQEMMSQIIPLSLIRLKLYCESPNHIVPKIEIKVEINKNIENVWKYYTEEKHIVNWNFADFSWHCPKALNNLEHGAKFNFRMEAKDSSSGFDFEGIYNKIETNKLISFTLLDGKDVKIYFQKESKNKTKLNIIFEAESQNSLELQKQG